MQHIFLIGLPGSGKSTIGHILAQRLNIPLLDIDALIEKECNERIASIFSQHGEDYFRSCESRLLAKAAQGNTSAPLKWSALIYALAPSEMSRRCESGSVRAT